MDSGCNDIGESMRLIFLTIFITFFSIFSFNLGSEPLTFLEVEEEGYLIVSEDSNEILMVDHSNQKWLRGQIYSGNPVKMRYGSGACIKDFNGWENLKRPSDLSLELETKLTTHYVKIVSEELKDVIKGYKKN